MATWKSAEYPQRKCREHVWNDVGLAYGCELPDLHTGPCASQSVQRASEARDRWEAANPDLVGQSLPGGDIIL